MEKINEVTLRASEVQHDIDLLLFLIPDMEVAQVETSAIHRALIDLMEFRDILPA